jgi:hypothetical protein
MEQTENKVKLGQHKKNGRGTLHVGTPENDAGQSHRDRLHEPLAIRRIPCLARKHHPPALHRHEAIAQGQRLRDILLDQKEAAAPATTRATASICCSPPVTFLVLIA